MEEKKLTAEEIVKKLNYIKEQYLSYIYNDDDECKVLFVDDILDLIHRLQSENKELKSPKFASWKLKFFNLKEEFDKELSGHEEFTKKAKAEIERLKIDIKNEKNWGKIQTKQAVKDTAKGILDKCIAIDKATGGKGFVCIEAIAELAKGKGVEVE